MVVCRFTFTSRIFLKLFSNFYYTRVKKSDMICFECRDRRFHLFAMKGGVFAVKGNLQFLSKREDKSCDFYVYLKNTNCMRK